MNRRLDAVSRATVAVATAIHLGASGPQIQCFSLSVTIAFTSLEVVGLLAFRGCFTVKWGAGTLDFMDFDTDDVPGAFGFGDSDGDQFDPASHDDAIGLVLTLCNRMMETFLKVTICFPMTCRAPQVMMMPNLMDKDPLPGPISSGFDQFGTDRSVTGEISLQPTVSETFHNAMFSRALLINCDVSIIALPWETGLYEDFFSNEPFSPSLVPTVQIDEFCGFGCRPEPQKVAAVVAEAASSSAPESVFASCFACVDDGFVQMKRQHLHVAAVSKLLIVLRHRLLASSTGRHIIALGTEQMQVSGAPRVLEAVLGLKPPATLVTVQTPYCPFALACKE